MDNTQISVDEKQKQQEWFDAYSSILNRLVDYTIDFMHNNQQIVIDKIRFKTAADELIMYTLLVTANCLETKLQVKCSRLKLFLIKSYYKYIHKPKLINKNWYTMVIPCKDKDQKAIIFNDIATDIQNLGNEFNKYNNQNISWEDIRNNWLEGIK